MALRLRDIQLRQVLSKHHTAATPNESSVFSTWILHLKVLDKYPFCDDGKIASHVSARDVQVFPTSLAPGKADFATPWHLDKIA